MKLLMEVGVVGAGEKNVMLVWRFFVRGKGIEGRRTSCAVKDCQIQDVGSAALGSSARAEGNELALIEEGSGSCESGGDESDEDGGELHVCWFVWVFLCVMTMVLCDGA